jgi:hypothetical protein
LHQDEAEDGRVDVMSCVGPCYTYLTIFIIVDTRSILVF